MPTNIKKTQFLQWAIKSWNHARKKNLNLNLENLFIDLQQLQNDLMSVPVNDQLWMQGRAIQDQIQKLIVEQEIFRHSVRIKIGLPSAIKILNIPK